MTTGHTLVLAALAALFVLIALVFFIKRGKASRRPPPPLRPGTVKSFAKGFELKRIIGAGGMGEVFEAVDCTLQRRVALKRLAAEIRRDPAGRAQFLQEARIVAALRHPHIVEIHSVIDEGPELYLVFEYVDGETLDARVRARGRVEPAEGLKLLRQICSALDYSHSQKVLHRDLKLSNIMVDAAGVVKVMDFGIARQARQTLANITRGEITGTLAYMAPEQHLGQEKRPADIYALGVCAYRMLSGHLPFGGPDFLRQKEHVEYQPLSAFFKGVGPDLDRVMAKVFSVTPQARPLSATEFLSDLHLALNSVMRTS